MIINDNDIYGIEEINDGLDPVFSWHGCENCANGLGNSVYPHKAWFKDENSQDDYYEIDICNGCLCAYHNTDELPQDCRNIFKI